MYARMIWISGLIYTCAVDTYCSRLARADIKQSISTVRTCIWEAYGHVCNICMYICWRFRFIPVIDLHMPSCWRSDLTISVIRIPKICVYVRANPFFFLSFFSKLIVFFSVLVVKIRNQRKQALNFHFKLKLCLKHFPLAISKANKPRSVS